MVKYTAKMPICLFSIKVENKLTFSRNIPLSGDINEKKHENNLCRNQTTTDETPEHTIDISYRANTIAIYK